MVSVRWFVKSIFFTVTTTGVKIVIVTDTACHLYMRWSLHEPWYHRIPVTRRGVEFLADNRICFTVYEDNEQEEAGDTLEHTFIKEPWAHCETRYFYFHGTIAGIASVSTSPIYAYHRIYTPPPGEWIVDEPWPDKPTVDGRWYTSDDNWDIGTIGGRTYIYNIIAGITDFVIPIEPKAYCVQQGRIDTEFYAGNPAPRFPILRVHNQTPDVPPPYLGYGYYLTLDNRSPILRLAHEAGDEVIGSFDDSWSVFAWYHIYFDWYLEAGQMNFRWYRGEPPVLIDTLVDNTWNLYVDSDVNRVVFSVRYYNRWNTTKIYKGDPRLI